MMIKDFERNSSTLKSGGLEKAEIDGVCPSSQWMLSNEKVYVRVDSLWQTPVNLMARLINHG